MIYTNSVSTRHVGRYLALSFFIGLFSLPATAGDIDVAFVMDGSGSIDAADFALQKQGLMSAVANQQLVPLDGSVAVTIIQFAGSSTAVEVPYRVIQTLADVNVVTSQIAAIAQLGGGTNPGDGILAATSVLDASGRPTAAQSICVSTDGVPNAGASLASAVAAAQGSTIGIDTFGVIGIECPGQFSEADLLSTYGSLVYGGGGSIMVFSSVEFANTIGPACFGGQLRLVGLEVNQSVQDWENSIPLVQGKVTYVRAHVEPLDPAEAQTVAQARLRAFSSGNELPGSPLQPINPGGQVIAMQNAAARRGDWNASLNFRLPSSWTQGSVELFLEGASGGIDCSQAAAIGNDCRLQVSFQPVTTPQVKFVGVKYKDSAGNVVAPPATATLTSRLRAVYPISSVDAEHATTDLTGASTPPTNPEILSHLQWQRYFDLCFTTLGCDRIYYGALDGSGGGQAAGCDSEVSFGYLPPNNALVYGYNRHAHEIGHNLGVAHAPFCDAIVGNCGPIVLTFDSNATGQATLGPMTFGQDEIVYGLDTLKATPRVIDPNNTFAMMSYCGGTAPNTRRWIAKPTYEALPGALSSVFTLNGGSGGGVVPVPLLMIGGSIDDALDQVDFMPAVTFTPAQMPPSPDAGPYSAELLDATDTVLSSIAFLPLALEPDQADSETTSERATDEHDAEATHGDVCVALHGSADSALPNDADGSGQATNESVFLVPLVADPSATKVVVKKNGIAIGELVASANAPQVQILFPNGGETLSGVTSVEWSASDLDGDALSYLLQYSSDGGTTWTTLVVNWKQTTYDVDFDELPGTGAGVLRVFASDGFHSVFDDSDSFFVTDEAPTVAILTPTSGEQFFGVQTIFLSADISDVEDSVLPDASVIWSSNVDGELGIGADLQVVASDLTEGPHVIGVMVTDSAGNTTVETVDIEVKTIFDGGVTSGVTMFRPGDTLIGTFEEYDHTFDIDFWIVEKTTLRLVFPATKEKTTRVSVVIVDPDGLIEQSFVFKYSPNHETHKAKVLKRTGRYTMRINPIDGDLGGEFKVKTDWKLPKKAKKHTDKVKGPTDTSSPGILSVYATPGAVVDLRFEPKQNVDPADVSVALMAPGGTMLDLTPFIDLSFGVLVADGIPLPEGGVYGVQVSGLTSKKQSVKVIVDPKLIKGDKKINLAGPENP